MSGKKQKGNKTSKKIIGPITFIIVLFLIIYTTIASAALNANLQISGDATFVPYLDFVKEFNYMGSCEEFIVPKSGTYKLETWGASGGNPGSGMAGNGGYSAGNINLFKGDKLYACVGGQGKTGSVASGNQVLEGGFNGGGNAWGFTDGNNGSGGGATDFRIGANSLYARVIVAGGGGGAVSAGDGPQAGHGGGTTALSGQTNFSGGCTAYGGTQTAGGKGSNCGSGFTPGQKGTTYDAVFGQGGSGRKAGITENRAGGGGGWYGGGSTFVIGGGGSGFVFVNGTSVPSGYMLSENYYLTDTQNINGLAAMPTHDGNDVMTGNKGDGFAKLTFITPVVDNIKFYLNGLADMQVNVNGTYTEQGATLIINDIDYSSSVVATGTVTTSTAGVYTKTYTYTYNDKVYKLIRRVLVQNAITYTESFNYTGTTVTKNAPYTGWYKLEVWGAQGGAGTGSNSPGGNGGYASGIVWITAGTSIYINVGQQGIKYSTGNYSPGGWNGGGAGGQPYAALTCSYYYGGGGGGATDIRLGGTSLYYRAIVGGGGGGASGYDNTPGGAAGGTSGSNGAASGGGKGGTQTGGGAAGSDGLLQNRSSYAGVFGEGGSGSLNTGAGTGSGLRSGGGGGSGWYGGGAGSNRTGNCVTSGSGGGAGGGGSSFIWYNGATVPTGYSVSSDYHMGKTTLTSGVRTGNGSATITFLES